MKAGGTTNSESASKSCQNCRVAERLFNWLLQRDFFLLVWLKTCGTQELWSWDAEELRGWKLWPGLIGASSLVGGCKRKWVPAGSCCCCFCCWWLTVAAEQHLVPIPLLLLNNRFSVRRLSMASRCHPAVPPPSPRRCFHLGVNLTDFLVGASQEAASLRLSLSRCRCWIKKSAGEKKTRKS